MGAARTPRTPGRGRRAAALLLASLSLAACSADQPSGAPSDRTTATRPASDLSVGDRLTGAEFAPLIAVEASAYARVHVLIAGVDDGRPAQVEGDLDVTDPADPRLALSVAGSTPTQLVLAGGVLFTGSPGGPFRRGDPADLPFGLDDRLGEPALGYVEAADLTGATYLGESTDGGLTAQRFETEGRGAADGSEILVSEGRVVRVTGVGDDGTVTVTFSQFGRQVVIEPPEKGQDLLD